MRNTLHVVTLALLVATAAARLEAAEVRTLAGVGRPGSTGDGGQSPLAEMNQPFGLVIGPDEDLYVCEVGNHRIRKVNLTSTIISTVAGSGKPGYSGDGQAALRALCNEPYEIRFDSEGRMLFVEMQNHLVRRVDLKTNVISTIAGTGVAGYTGDGGPALRAKLRQPHSIALDDAGNLYIADIGNHRVRRVDMTSGTIDTYAGTGARQPTPDGSPLAGTPLNGPRALAFDTQNRLLLALREGNAVYQSNSERTVWQHLAGTGKQGYAGDGGPALKALLAGPKGVALGPDGDVYLADTESHSIRVIRMKTGIIETLVGTGFAGDGPDGDPRACRLNRPHGVFVAADGRVYIGDSSNHRIRVYIPDLPE